MSVCPNAIAFYRVHSLLYLQCPSTAIRAADFVEKKKPVYVRPSRYFSVLAIIVMKLLEPCFDSHNQRLSGKTTIKSEHRDCVDGQQ